MNKLLQLSALIGGLSLAGASYGQTIEDVAITGPYDAWLSNGAGQLTLASPPPTPPSLDDILEGDAGSPGSNIELNNDGNFNVSTSLEGTLPGLEVEIRSPTQSDWTANGNELALAYVNGALIENGYTWNAAVCGDFATAVAAFVSAPNGAQRASDPNVGYVRRDGNQVRIGLQGQLDITTVAIPPPSIKDLLTTCATGYVSGDEVQASEVMFVKISRTDDGTVLFEDYKYGFSATPTGQQTSEGSYDGNYDITIPVPGPPGPPTPVPAASAVTLAGAAAGLLAIGLAGLRQRRST